MVRFGIVGLGVMGLGASKALAKEDYKGGSLAAVCDLNAELAKQVVTELNVP